MYTQCPACQTVFRITMEQMRAHNGLVRCGHCSKVFNADQQLFDDIPGAEPEKKTSPTAKKRTVGKTKAAAERPVRRRKGKPAPANEEAIEILAAPAPWEDDIAQPTTVAREDKPDTRTASTQIEEIFLSPRRRTPASAWWFAGSALLLLLLCAQTVYFYRDALATSNILRPTLREWCASLGCDLRPVSDVGRVELIQPTNIAPHPKYENMLRLRATMVSRAPAPQPYPLMEVTLTDNLGNVLARRAFTPNDYLERSALARTEMLPHVAVGALLDITNPDGKASGYEINFVAYHSQ